MAADVLNLRGEEAVGARLNDGLEANRLVLRMKMQFAH